MSYLNEYLIDDEEVVEYLTLRELMHIKLNMYRSRYGDGLSYAEKFDSILHFFIPKETMKRLGKDGKPDRGEPETSVTSFLWGLPAPPRAPRLGRRAPPEGCLCGEQEEEEKRGLSACRYRLTGLIIPVRKDL